MPTWRIPLSGLPPRCINCLAACPRCRWPSAETRLKMARLVLSLSRSELPWFPGWRLLEITLEDDND